MALRPERPENFIGGHMYEPKSVACAPVQSSPILERGGEHRVRTMNVGLDKGERAIDRAVYVGFGGEVQNDVGLIAVQRRAERTAIANIGMNELVARAVLESRQGLKIPRVCQLVVVYDTVGCFSRQQADEGRPDEA